MSERDRRRGVGMVLGKFLPPHRGHLYLLDFASQYVEELMVVVGSLPTEPIPGSLRARWLQELLPHADVLHLDEELPQEPSEHPDFWRLWEQSLRRILPRPPDYVFASEEYGATLAEVLDAEFVPVDPRRSVVPVSGTAIRRDPMRHWQYLPPCVRPHFVRRVCVFGPESTGKSTLAERLGREFETVVVPEYARTLIERRQGELEVADIERIARGQLAAEEALARRANRVLICDTDVIATAIWSEALFGSCAAWIRAEGERRRYDLTLLLDVDVPFVADAARYLPQQRRPFFDRCRHELERLDRSYVVVRGSWEERWRTAVEAVQSVLE